jgi:type I restriction enzyme, R subunit
VELRSKRALIEKFIHENLPHIEDPDDIPDEFFAFWDQEQKAAIEQLIEEENLDAFKTEKVIGDYLFTEQTPLRDDIISAMKTRPSLKVRGITAERITARILEFVETFISGMVGR